LAGTSSILSNQVAVEDQPKENNKKRKQYEENEDQDFESKMREKALAKQKLTAAKTSNKE
jgi:hypothetical protein